MHVLDHLTEEHRKAEQLLERLAKSDEGPERDRLVNELDDALTVHMAVEEMFLYPVACAVLDAEDVEEATTEHSLAREGLRKLHALAAQPGFGAAVDMLTAGIGHHVREEESELFPELRAKAGPQLDDMDPEDLESQARSSGRGGSDGPTKDELYAQARDAGIPGRSQMTKQELVDALHAST